MVKGCASLNLNHTTFGQVFWPSEYIQLKDSYFFTKFLTGFFICILNRTLARGDQTFTDEDYTLDDYYAALLSEDMSDFDEDLYLERMNRIKQG